MNTHLYVKQVLLLYYNAKYTFNNFRYLVGNTLYSFACYEVMLIWALDTDFYTQMCHYLVTQNPNIHRFRSTIRRYYIFGVRKFVDFRA